MFLHSVDILVLIIRFSVNPPYTLTMGDAILTGMFVCLNGFIIMVS